VREAKEVVSLLAEQEKELKAKDARLSQQEKELSHLAAKASAAGLLEAEYNRLRGDPHCKPASGAEETRHGQGLRGGGRKRPDR